MPGPRRSYFGVPNTFSHCGPHANATFSPWLNDARYWKPVGESVGIEKQSPSLAISWIRSKAIASLPNPGSLHDNRFDSLKCVAGYLSKPRISDNAEWRRNNLRYNRGRPSSTQTLSSQCLPLTLRKSLPLALSLPLTSRKCSSSASSSTSASL